MPAPIARMNDGVKEFADAGVAREGAGKDPRGNRGEETNKQIIGDGSWGVNAAEFVVGDVDGPGEEPQYGKRE